MKIAFVNQKGGVAKTTSCHNIGAALARAGRKVLLVDLDPQGNLTKDTGTENPEITISDILEGSATREAILHLESYDLIPADLSASAVKLEDSERLRSALKRLSYDYILIDCQPSLGPLTIQALTAADRVIIPVVPQALPVAGVLQILDTMQQVKDLTNPGLALLGILISMANSRRALDKAMEEAIRKSFPEDTFQAVVKSNSKIAEASYFQKDIFEYDPKGQAAEIYTAVAKEIMERGFYHHGKI